MEECRRFLFHYVEERRAAAKKKERDKNAITGFEEKNSLCLLNDLCLKVFGFGPKYSFNTKGLHSPNNKQTNNKQEKEMLIEGPI